jgi:hypothetical protein
MVPVRGPEPRSQAEESESAVSAGTTGNEASRRKSGKKENAPCEASDQRMNSGCGSTIGRGSTLVPLRLVPPIPGGRGLRCRAIVAFARSVVRLLRRLISAARAVVTAAVRRVRIPRTVISVGQLKPHRFPRTSSAAAGGSVPAIRRRPLEESRRQEETRDRRRSSA